MMQRGGGVMPDPQAEQALIDLSRQRRLVARLGHHRHQG